MARNIKTIIEEMDLAQAAETNLSELNSPSQTAIYRLWKSITATVINYLEQLWDIFKLEIETVISKGKVGSTKWLQNKVFNFQYSPTIPQVIQIIDFAPSYYIVDPKLRIVTRCSVKTAANKVVSIKVAKSEPPEALNATEINSLKGYVNEIGFAGIQAKVTTFQPDIFFLKANIYYDGQYSSTIQASVIAAIKDYFANLPFDGTIKMLTLEDYIQSVPGVTDVVIIDAAIRINASAFSAKTFIVQASTTLSPTHYTYAGYVVPETTIGETLADRITFIGQ